MHTKLDPSFVSQPLLNGSSTLAKEEPFSCNTSTSEDKTKKHEKFPESQTEDGAKPRTGRLVRKKSLSENCLVAVTKMDGMVDHITASQTLSRRGLGEPPVRNQVFERPPTGDEAFQGEQIQVNGRHWEVRNTDMIFFSFRICKVSILAVGA